MTPVDLSFSVAIPVLVPYNFDPTNVVMFIAGAIRLLLVYWMVKFILSMISGG